MNNLLLVVPVVLYVAVPSLQAQEVDTVAAYYAKGITMEDLRRDLTILASDEYEGRDTGKEGQKMAAAYLREQFMSYGIPPITGVATGSVVEGYYQPVQLVEEVRGTISIRAQDKVLRLKEELFYFSEVLSGNRDVKEMVFIGEGSSSAMTKVSPGSVVLMVEDGESNVLALLSNLRSRSSAATDAGIDVLLVATPRLDGIVEELGHYFGGGRMRLATDEAKPQRPGSQVILVDQSSMDGLLGRRKLASLVKGRTGRKVRTDMVLVHSPQENTVLSENVLAYIEGGDKKEELVVITAHYDHIGEENGEIYNGADDDGSGTVAIMAIAKAFAQAKAEGHGPRRSVLVMPVTAEEKGLLGSKYYSEHPIFPLENTVANLNIDMIGRVDPVHTGSAPYIYVIGSDRLSTELHAINEEANRDHVGLELDYTFNALDDPNRFYFRSDHYNFARKGIPAIFYFSGVHEDYHGPGDTVDKIMFDLLHQRALLTFHTAWILANREDRIVVDGKVD